MFRESATYKLEKYVAWACAEINPPSHLHALRVFPFQDVASQGSFWPARWKIPRLETVLGVKNERRIPSHWNTPKQEKLLGFDHVLFWSCFHPTCIENALPFPFGAGSPKSLSPRPAKHDSICIYPTSSETSSGIWKGRLPRIRIGYPEPEFGMW